MPVQSYDPVPIAKEVVEIFAKYQIPIAFKDTVYKTIDTMLEQQTVVVGNILSSPTPNPP